MYISISYMYYEYNRCIRIVIIILCVYDIEVIICVPLVRIICYFVLFGVGWDVGRILGFVYTNIPRVFWALGISFLFISLLGLGLGFQLGFQLGLGYMVGDCLYYVGL